MSLSSPDLVHRHVADRDDIPMVDGKRVGNQKPQVVWSATPHRYLMWFAGPHGYCIAQATSPGGSWENVIKPIAPVIHCVDESGDVVVQRLQRRDVRVHHVARRVECVGDVTSAACV